jgi:hypothetical protein
VDRIAPTQIVHIPHVLYHWRIHEASTAAGNAVKPYALEAGRRAILEHLERNGLSGSVQGHPSGHYVVEYAPPSPAPSVVVIGEATPASCNAAANASDADILVFLDARCVPDDKDWLQHAVAWAARPGTGAVGGKLYRQDGVVVGNGLLINVAGPWSAMDGGARADGDGYAGRAKLSQNLTALTHGLIVIARKAFVDAGGFDASFDTLAGATMDLTLRLHANGLRNTWVPSLRMRFDAADDAFAVSDADRRRLEERWKLSAMLDPAYNPNLGNKSTRYWYAHPPRVPVHASTLANFVSR